MLRAGQVHEGEDRVSDKCVIMSDIVGSQRITIRVPETLGSRLRDRYRANGQTPSEVVRAALETYLEEASGQRSAYELAKEAGLIGCVRRAPKDLSTNRRHMEGFGSER